MLGALGVSNKLSKLSQRGMLNLANSGKAH